MYCIGIRHSLSCMKPTHTKKATESNKAQVSRVFNINLPSDTSMNLCTRKVHVRTYQRIYPAELRSTRVVFPPPTLPSLPRPPMCSTNGSVHTHHKTFFTTMTCKISINAMSAIPYNSCIWFLSYLPLFQAVSKVPVPPCHVPHITAHAILLGDHASSSPPHQFFFSGHISFSSLINITTLPSLIGRRG